MDFRPASELLRHALEGGYAVPAFCTWDAGTMNTVLRVASDCRAPVILMTGPLEFGVLSPAQQARVARAVASAYAVPAALHLDHGATLQQAKECVQAGYTSVMLDFSQRPFEENATAVREVVELAKPEGVSVEALDPRSLSPLDEEAILASVRKTHRLVIVHEEVKFAGSGAEIAAMVAEKAFDYLDAPILRVAAPFCPVPFSSKLEAEFVPSEEKIADAVKTVMEG